MPDTSARLADNEPAAPHRPEQAVRPFLGLIDPILVPSNPSFEFDGALAEAHAASAWTWVLRDAAPDLIAPPADDAAAMEALDLVMPELLQRIRTVVEAAQREAGDSERRLRIQFGGEEAYARLPVLLNALKCRALLQKAQSFGRAANAMTDEAGLGLALQSMPLNDHAVSSLLMQAAIGQVANPSRLITAVIRITGSATEQAVQRAGFGPLVDAMLSHAQAQIAAVNTYGAFPDIDLTCRAIERFHRLMRAVHLVEFGRLSRWSTVSSSLTTQISARLEPKLRNVVPDVNRSLRRGKEGQDRLDSDLLLSALNGCYVLATVRDCRDSLALNAVFEEAWTQVAQVLEMHVERNLEAFRQQPGDQIAQARLDAAIKMTELRFNAEYADVLRRVRDGADKRAI